MSVLIKGMEVPKSCWECFVNRNLNVNITLFGGHCPFAETIVRLDEFDAKGGRHPECPIIEVPPHGGLVDGGKIKKAIREYIDKYGKIEISITKFNIILERAQLPTIIEAEEGER